MRLSDKVLFGGLCLTNQNMDSSFLQFGQMMDNTPAFKEIYHHTDTPSCVADPSTNLPDVECKVFFADLHQHRW